MQLSFRTLSTFTAALCVLLALVWGLVPDWLLAIGSIEYSTATGLVARRSAILFAALGMILYGVRNEAPSVTRNALSNGFIAGSWGLAVLGFGEWLNGHAGPGILVSVVVELALGLAFLQTKRVSVEPETVN
jgi:TM2 domain-containing membrane protein YozV